MSDDHVPPALTVLRQSERWAPAVEHLRNDLRGRREEVVELATRTARAYEGRRGAMVFDVVYSRQRDYQRRVLPAVARWESDVQRPDLATLAKGATDPHRYGMAVDEAATMTAVARNLTAFGKANDLPDDDATCKHWATAVQTLELTPKLDPVVGGVHGIGPALFAYMRLRSGADTVKVDLRVIRRLRAAGLGVPGTTSGLVLCQALAAELGIRTAELDKLLWWAP